jgi:hypothetical protein
MFHSASEPVAGRSFGAAAVSGPRCEAQSIHAAETICSPQVVKATNHSSSTLPHFTFCVGVAVGPRLFAALAESLNRFADEQTAKHSSVPHELKFIQSRVQVSDTVLQASPPQILRRESRSPYCGRWEWRGGSCCRCTHARTLNWSKCLGDPKCRVQRDQEKQCSLCRRQRSDHAKRNEVMSDVGDVCNPHAVRGLH